MRLPQRILVTRFSAMGDVAMVASVLKDFLKQYPHVEIIMVSRKFFEPFFADQPKVTFHAIEPKGKHKGVLGLWQLKKELMAFQPDAVADLHNNLRSRILDFYFGFEKIPLEILDKGRAEKKALTRPQNKVFKQLKPTTERYADVFRKLGFTFSLTNELKENKQPLPDGIKAYFSSNHPKIIGISPFAQHEFKVFPLQKMEQVIAELDKKGYGIILFGGGETEKNVADNWASKYKNVYNSIGKFTLGQELAIISHLDLMISMDSSGMHMASLMGVRTISLWGATHPFAGFLGYGQSLSDCVQVEHASRPSSVYGNKSCLCEGIEAIDLITPEMVIDKIETT